MAIPCTDPALHVVQVVMAALREVFDPDSDCPPDGGGTKDVRFLATDNAALPAGLFPGCKSGPLVWVRLDRRYRSKRSGFPAADVSSGPCGSSEVVPVVALEIGVLRCTSMDAEYVNWDKVTVEELVALDDSWRIETALTVARCRLQSKTRAVATDTVAPIGPEGNLRAWTGMLYVQLEKVT